MGQSEVSGIFSHSSCWHCYFSRSETEFVWLILTFFLLSFFGGELARLKKPVVLPSIIFFFSFAVGCENNFISVVYFTANDRSVEVIQLSTRSS
tara:strand:+ start:4912 stop:5193 length:282 start_codon:yes stop_codon:yes gene_type:complete